MLKIQEFIITHQNDWRELLSAAPYNLKISEDDGFILFKYNQISSDFSQEICKEARGLILDSQDNFRVVRYSFYKFFNINEPFAATIDWKTATSTEKIDGSIMALWYARGEWHLSTNGSINAYKTELPIPISHKNFGELFDAAAQKYNLDYSKLNPNYCYTFELVSSENKVVISYSEPDIYLLSIRNMTTLEEEEDYQGIESVQRPCMYNLNSEEEYCNFVSSMPEGHEGIVVKDGRGNRVKIKTLLYFELHRQHNNGKLTLERIVDLVRANDHAEFLSYFPEMTEEFTRVEKQILKVEGIVEKIKQDVAYWKLQFPDAPKKWFAQDFKDKTLKHLYFAEYDGKLNFAVQELPTKKFISIFKIHG